MRFGSSTTGALFRCAGSHHWSSARALPPGPAGSVALTEDVDLLRRDGPALPALAGGGGCAALRGGRRRAGTHLPSVPGDQDGEVGPAAGAQDDPGVASVRPVLPALGSPRG